MTSNKKSGLSTLLVDVIIILVIVIAVTIFIKPIIVKQTSMLPTLQENNYVLLSRQAYRFGEPQRGQIVVFPVKDEFGDKELYIKRVIGLPGDRIKIENNEVYINGQKEDQSFTEDGYTPYYGADDDEESVGEVLDLTVPKGELFVMGDNRVVSQDSRVIGTVAISKVTGVAFFRLWPFNEFGKLERYE